MPKGPYYVEEEKDLLGDVWWVVVNQDTGARAAVCSDRDRAFTHRRRLNYEYQRTLALSD